MDSSAKNKRTFDYKPIVVYIIVIVLGFFSAKVVFGFLFKGSAVKKIPAINTASVVPPPLVPEKTVVEAVVKPISKPVAVAAEVNIPAPEKTTPVIYASEEEAAKFVLNGIAFSEGQGQTSFALINNKVVKAGEKVAGAEVMKISRYSVELKTKDSKIVILSQKK